MSYESPIELFQTEPILEQIKSETDAYILQSVWKLGVNVNKDELIKALAFDRDQYDKGFHDGRMYQPPVMTNADRIRAMSDEELAEFIGCDPMHDICPNNCHEDLDRPCKVCALEWLKQEVNE